MTPRKVLVVDDDADSARMLEVMVEMLGHERRCAFDGREALEAALDFRPDVAMLDLTLPDVDGFALARQLRALPGLERLTLIAVSGWSDPETKERAKREGFDRFLVKPIDVRRLEEIFGGQGAAAARS
jgi:CheY-like chemotaxis protein